MILPDVNILVTASAKLDGLKQEIAHHTTGNLTFVEI